jgi:outer membrane protein assembly factor BamE
MRTPLTCLLFVCLCIAALAGCNLPRVHKVTVQQGNVITQEMIDKLKPGMTRSQVAFVMGEPIFRNSFDDDRWDYVYTLEVPGYYQEEKKVSLYFDRDVLAYFTGDYAPSKATAGTRGDAGQSTTASTPADTEETPTES